MKLTVERLSESRAVLDIAADEDEFAKAMDRAYRRVGTQITVPGFRRGKAPRAMIERLYGREIFIEEAHKGLMSDLYRKALEQEELVPVGEPEVDLVEMEPLAFKVTIPVYPTVEPGPYTEARVEPADASVDEAAVDEVIERLQKTHSPWVDPAEGGLEVGADLVLERAARSPREGDQVTIDYSVREGDEPFQDPVEDALFVLGESNLLDRLREEIERLKIGEPSTFEVTYGEDDTTVDPTMHGKTLTYNVTLKGLKERDLLLIDDDFAQTVAETDTLEQLRRDIRNDLHQGKTGEARTEVLNAIIDAIAEKATIELPAPMIDEALEDDIRSLRNRLAGQGMALEAYLRLSNQTEDELRAELRPQAERRLRNSLLLREIANREQIAVEDAELQAEVDRLSAAAEGAADPERARNLYQSDYFRNVIRGDMFERRLTDRLIEVATEGRGAVVNGWVEPEPEPVLEAAAVAAAESAGESAAADSALTLGTMPGQPGDLAATTLPAGDDEAVVSVDDVAAAPDVAQAAATGHEEENEAVSTEAPDEAVTPEEREAEGEPGAGGSLPTPTH